MIHESEVVEWKHHPVTIEFFQAIKGIISGLSEEIVDGARTADPRDLSFKAGAVQALRDVLDTDF